MYDDDMLAATRSSLTSIRDSLTDVHMDRPPGAIIAQAAAGGCAEAWRGSAQVDWR